MLGIGVGAMIAGVGCATNSGEANPSNAETLPTVASDATVEPVVSASVDTTPPHVDTVVESTAVSFVWPPIFAVPGSTLAVQVVAKGPRPDAITIDSSASTISTQAMFDAASNRWTATIDVPAPLSVPTIALSATATLGDTTSAPVSLTVPVTAGSQTIEPQVVDIAPAVSVELDFGSGPGQIGIDFPEFQGEVQVPRSLQIDPSSGDIVILDSVNRRLVVVTTGGAVVDTIGIDGSGLLDDLVVLGTTRRAVVTEFRGAGAHRLEVSAHLIDLDAGTDTVDGPFLIPPPSPPVGTELVWNEALDAVFGVVYDPATDRVGHYRVFDTAREQLDVSTVPEFWWHGRVSADGSSAGVEYDGTTILTALPHSFAGLSNVIVQPNGTVWWSAGTVDPDAAPGGQVHYYVARTDLGCPGSVITEIDISGMGELATRSMVADDTGVYVVDLAESYRLVRFELPPPACSRQLPSVR